MRSLQLRLSLGLLLSLLLAFMLLWLLVSNASRYLAENYITTRLQHDTESLLTAVQFRNDGQLSLDHRLLNPIYQRPFSGHYYKIQSGHTRLRSRSLWDQDLVVQPLDVGQQHRRHLRGPQQQPLLMLTSRFNKDNRQVTISVAENLSPVEADLAHLQYYFTLAAVLLLLGLMAVQGLILHAGLRPLDRTRRELQALVQGQLTHLDQNVPTEISPLVEEINHLLTILDNRLKRSRHALGDLAHALKKPLTVLNQLAHDPVLADHPELQQNLLNQLASIQHPLSRILQRARLAGEGPVSTLFSFDEEMPALLNTLQQMYYSKSLRIEQNLPAQLSLAIDREDMLELIGNLLDNACKWAAQTVRITVSRDDDAFTVIEIEDDGPGVAEDQLAALTQRGTRLDETTEGHGLGLAIAQEIIISLSGRLQLQRSPSLGGLQVRVVLPA
ncbi:MAG: ATP-binding protein [Gammaproteobacteria bacterium]|jgi:signal transduction histidine kinase